mmetsp:Transcript_5874/g.8454  ORF Transcript_5874/g.8454 Transcript_5874/m.8454 type:complete len:88 (+) Transcript_5874:804-1067(+)
MRVANNRNQYVKGYDDNQKRKNDKPQYGESCIIVADFEMTEYDGVYFQITPSCEFSAEWVFGLTFIIVEFVTSVCVWLVKNGVEYVR